MNMAIQMASAHLASWIRASLVNACFQDAPQEACLAALTRLQQLSLAQPVDDQPVQVAGNVGFGDRLTILSSLCSLQVNIVLAL